MGRAGAGPGARVGARAGAGRCAGGAGREAGGRGGEGGPGGTAEWRIGSTCGGSAAGSLLRLCFCFCLHAGAPASGSEPWGGTREEDALDLFTTEDNAHYWEPSSNQPDWLEQMFSLSLLTASFICLPICFWVLPGDVLAAPASTCVAGTV